MLDAGVCALWIEQSFQQAVRYGGCLKRLRQRYQLGDLSVEMKESSFLPLYFLPFGFILLCLFFFIYLAPFSSSAFHGNIVCGSPAVCISMPIFKTARKRKEKKNAVEQIELGLFVFSVLFNAQLFLEVLLFLCVPFFPFPLPSAPYGSTCVCVCYVCMCVHAS